MKIELERTTRFVPNKLSCAVCIKAFEVEPIRYLLYSDRGLLQGDLCQSCRKSSASAIQARIHERAWSLSQKTTQTPCEEVEIEEKVTEMLSLAEENIIFPTILQHWLKKMEIAAEESMELERARFGLNKCDCEKRQQLEHLLKESET